MWISEFLKSKMNRFSDNAENDSFDDILATMDVPSTAKASSSSSTQAKDASPAKKQRLSSFENDDDDLLANVVMPETTTAHQTGKPANVPISAGKTNCVLVNPKQRGTCALNQLALTIVTILTWYKILKLTLILQAIQFSNRLQMFRGNSMTQSFPIMWLVKRLAFCSSHCVIIPSIQITSTTG